MFFVWEITIKHDQKGNFPHRCWMFQNHAVPNLLPSAPVLLCTEKPYEGHVIFVRNDSRDIRMAFRAQKTGGNCADSHLLKKIDFRIRTT